MRYYDLIETPKTHKTFLEGGANRLPQTDSRVEDWFKPIDAVKYDRGFVDYGIGKLPTLIEYALQEDNTRYSHYLDTPDDEGIYQPDLDKIAELNQEIINIDSKNNREIAIESPITYLGVVWDTDEKARNNIAVAIRKAERENLTQRLWRLHDNTWRETTLDELKGLLNAYDDRFEDVWNQFGLWTLSGSIEVFSYEENV